jgi:hypothetical protein
MSRYVSLFVPKLRHFQNRHPGMSAAYFYKAILGGQNQETAVSKQTQGHYAAVVSDSLKVQGLGQGKFAAIGTLQGANPDISP